MKLEPPLEYLIKTCETYCVAECCGLDAYNFSPIHIASYLNDSRDAAASKNQIETLLKQLADIKEKYGKANKVEVEQMNQTFSGKLLIELMDEISTNIPVALDLIEQSEARRAPRTNAPS